MEALSIDKVAEHNDPLRSDLTHLLTNDKQAPAPALIMLPLPLMVGVFISFCLRTRHSIKTLLDTDTLFPVVLSMDLRQGLHRLLQWNLPPAPSFFPDLVSFYPIYILTRSPFFSIIAYSIFATGVLGLILAMLHRSLNERQHSGTLWQVILILGLWMEAIHSRTQPAFSSLLLPGFHGGAIINALLVFLATSRYLLGGQRMLLACIAGLLLVAVPSDRLFLILAPVPLCASLCLYGIQGNHESRRRCLSVLITLLIGTGCGLLTAVKIAEFLPIAPPPPPWFPGHLWESLVQASRAMLGDLIHHPIASGSIMLGFLSGIWLLFGQRGSNNRMTVPQEPIRRLLITTILLALLSSFVAPLITGLYRANALRYVTPAIVFGALLTSLACSHIGSLSRKGISITLISGWLLLLGRWQGLFVLNGDPLRKRSLAACLQSRTSISQLHHSVGVSDYWQANRVNALTKKSLRVLPVYADFRPYQHLINNQWFDKSRLWERPPHLQPTFVIIDRLNKRRMERSCTAPSDVFHCGSSMVYVFSGGCNFSAGGQIPSSSLSGQGR